MASNVHITHIEDTVANILANADHGQSAIPTNTTADIAHPYWLYVDDDKSYVYASAPSKRYNVSGGTWGYLDAGYNSLTVNDATAGAGLLIAKHLTHLGDTDTRLEFADAGNTVNTIAGGVTNLQVTASTVEVNVGNAEVAFIVNSLGVESAFAVDGYSGQVYLANDPNSYWANIGSSTFVWFCNSAEVARLEPTGLVLGRAAAATVGPIDAVKVSAVNYLRYDTYSSYAYWQMRRSGGTTIGTAAETSDGDVIGRIDAFGVTTGPAFSSTPSTVLYFAQDGASSATHVPGRISMYTSTDAALAERLRITNGGIVSIGAGAPLAWKSASYAVLAIGPNTAWAAFPDAGGYGHTAELVANAYFDVTDSQWEYGDAGAYASRYTMDGCDSTQFHTWYIAAMGTNAGDAITWNEVMQIEGNGSTGALVVNEDSIDFDVRWETNGDDYMLFSDGGNNKLCVSTGTALAAKLTVLQDDSSGESCLSLSQQDASEGFIDFVGTDVGVVAIGDNSVASVRVEVNGTKYLIPLLANA